jgi:hypothetical protein
MVTLPRGTYRIECWGAQGGSTNGGGAATGVSKIGGSGGYSAGEITLKSPTTVYINVGGEGLPQAISAPGGFNGGGNAAAGSVIACGGGGGASDVRLGNHSVYSRVSVAGGGGAAGFQECNGSAGVISGGHGGGATGGTPIAGGYSARIGQGGTQTAGGAGGFETYGSGNTGSFGLGGDGSTTGTSANGGGGGGGWYGGGAGANGSNCAAGGGGGSGYVYTMATAGSYPSGCLLTNSHYLAGAQVIAGDQTFLSPDGTSETGHAGNGHIRITTLAGGGSGDVYPGDNLAVFELVSPVNNTDSICTPDYLPVQISLANVGANNHDFTRDNVTIGYEIINPRGTVLRGVAAIDTGGLLSSESMDVELMPSLPILGGTYTVRAWVISAIDNFICDDTLKASYTSPKLALPIREDFSAGIPMEFISIPGNGSSKWEWYGGSAVIQPDSGTGMVRFGGTSGSVSHLSTGQLDLYQAASPFVEFFYYHDTTTSASDYSWTDINVVVNDSRVDNLARLYLRDPGGRHGWTHYRYDLSNYTAGNDCILMQFEAINRYPGTAQYIDYVRISSEQDAAVTEIIVTPEPSLCTPGSGSNISVVIEATRAQSIAFDNGASLILEVNGVAYPVSLQGKVIIGNTSETVPVLSGFPIGVGTTAMKAYFGTPVDNIRANDTAKYSLVFRPDFEIGIQPLSDNQHPASAEFKHNQTVIIENTGNVDLPDIGLILTVSSDRADGEEYHFTTKKTLGKSLSPGEKDTVAFDSPYTVPWASTYAVTVHGYLLCDSALVDTAVSVQETVNMNDLYIVDILQPSRGTTDTVNRRMEVSIKVKNRNLGKVYDPGEVKAGILIKDSNGIVLDDDIFEELPTIGGRDSIIYIFSGKYEVPEQNYYYLTVYIEKVDNYTDNDTLTLRRETNYDESGITEKSKASFTLEQNIPNPAQNSTVITYSIPQDGEITFRVHSVSGQLLYSQQENVAEGKHRIKLNISDYASGVYFYTMEYKGQRITRRMNITR